MIIRWLYLFPFLDMGITFTIFTLIRNVFLRQGPYVRKSGPDYNDIYKEIWRFRKNMVTSL